MLASLWIAEIRKHAVAHVFGNKTAIALDHLMVRRGPWLFRDCRRRLATRPRGRPNLPEKAADQRSSKAAYQNSDL
jgi:hypothetical protein